MSRPLIPTIKGDIAFYEDAANVIERLGTRSEFPADVAQAPDTFPLSSLFPVPCEGRDFWAGQVAAHVRTLGMWAVTILDLNGPVEHLWSVQYGEPRRGFGLSRARAIYTHAEEDMRKWKDRSNRRAWGYRFKDVDVSDLVEEWRQYAAVGSTIDRVRATGMIVLDRSERPWLTANEKQDLLRDLCDIACFHEVELAHIYPSSRRKQNTGRPFVDRKCEVYRKAARVVAGGMITKTGRLGVVSGERTVVLVLSNVNDSHVFADKYGEQRWQTMLDSHYQRAARLTRRIKGWVIPRHLDEIQAVFLVAGNAVEYARELEREPGIKDALDVQLRVGVCTAKVMVSGSNDANWAAWHMARSICAKAKPSGGGIWMSDAIRKEPPGVNLDWKDEGLVSMPSGSEHHLWSLPPSVRAESSVADDEQQQLFAARRKAKQELEEFEKSPSSEINLFEVGRLKRVKAALQKWIDQCISIAVLSDLMKGLATLEHTPWVLIIIGEEAGAKLKHIR